MMFQSFKALGMFNFIQTDIQLVSVSAIYRIDISSQLKLSTRPYGIQNSVYGVVAPVHHRA